MKEKKSLKVFVVGIEPARFGICIATLETNHYTEDKI